MYRVYSNYYGSSTERQAISHIERESRKLGFIQTSAADKKNEARSILGSVDGKRLSRDDARNLLKSIGGDTK